jgi:hypothetical protein
MLNRDLQFTWMMLGNHFSQDRKRLLHCCDRKVNPDHYAAEYF